ncbi:acyltransferase family protein [Marinicaulis aureus]|uniref:Acyltransferase family protein n=1 Tax=Hyphococcus aureus TaxID=2666033 RepID=A0ABW1KW84_9PROT
MTPAAPQIKTVHSIQFLRFLAAALVVAYHSFHFVDLKVLALSERLMHFTTFGASGVHIFFVISGFIMVWTSEGKFGKASSISGFAPALYQNLSDLLGACGGQHFHRLRLSSRPAPIHQ